MKIFIKNMLSLRCIICVRAILDRLDISYTKAVIGEIEIPVPLVCEKFTALKNELEAIDLYIIEDKKSVVVEQVKLIIHELIKNEPPRENYSVFISNRAGYNYTYLANLFSQHEGITIEHFIILQKIEQVKQLLLTGMFTLTEIAGDFHYSSVTHLSSQFKKVTGMTPSQYKQKHTKETSAGA